MCLYNIIALLLFNLLILPSSPSCPAPDVDAQRWNLDWIRYALAAENPALRHILSAIDWSQMRPRDDSQLSKFESISSDWIKEYGQCCSSPRYKSGAWCRRRRQCPRCVYSTHQGDLHQGTLQHKDANDDNVGDTQLDNHCLTNLGRHLNPQANTCCVNSLFQASYLPDCDCFELDADLRSLDSTASVNGQTKVWQVADKMIRSRMADLPAVFSVLLNFGVNGYWQFLISLQNVLGDNRCNDQFMWDPFANICRPVYCSQTSSTVDPSSPCVPYNETHADESQSTVHYVVEENKVLVTLYANVDLDSIDVEDEDAMLAYLQDRFVHSFCDFVSISCNRISNISVSMVTEDYDQQDVNSTNTNSTMVTVAIKFCLEEADSSAELSTDMVMAYLGSILFQDQLVSIVGGVPVQVVNIHEEPVTNPNTGYSGAWCRGNMATYGTNDFMMAVANTTGRDHNQTQFRVYVKSTESWYESGQYSAEILLRVSPSTSQLLGYVVVCDNRSLAITHDCRTIHLNESDFIFFGNGSVHYLGSLPFIRPFLAPGSYKSVGNGWVAVCLDLDYLNFPLALIIESYLSLVLTTISLSAMLVTIVTYLLFAELRNLPGLIILNLTISKFVFQLTFMLGMRQSVYQNSTLCLTIAILVHYEGLAAFFWSNVMAWDLFLTFGRRMSGAPRHLSKTFPRYALYAYGLPLMIVATSVTIFYCDCTGSFTIGYGKLMCWMSQPLATFLFFALPLALALAVNAVLFLITVTSIHRVSGSIKSWERHSGKNKAAHELWMYARMCTVMGFVWVFGLASSNTDIMTIPGLIVTYIYAILNALEGLFIFVAFTCNRRVAMLYRRLFRLQPLPGGRYNAENPTTFTAPKQTKTASVQTQVTSAATKTGTGAKSIQNEDQEGDHSLDQHITSLNSIPSL